MPRIYYAVCPHCTGYSAVEEADIDRDRVVCIDCGKEFQFEKELLKTLDEIVEEREDLSKPASGSGGARAEAG